MADINIGDVTARLRADTSDFTRGIQEANQRLQDLARQLTQMQQAQQSNAQGMQAAAQAIRDLARATQESTQTYAQAAQQALAYQRSQDELREALRQRREEERRANEEARASQEVWRQLLSIAGGVGIATGIQALVSQMTAFAKSVVDVGVQMQALRTTLGAIAGDASAGARQFQFLFDVGQRLGVSVTVLADGYRSLSAATRGTVLQGQETQKIFEGITIAGRAFGATSQQIGQGMLALEQMISKGTVSMEELRRQLGNAIPGAFELAAKAIGVTTEELNKLVASGELRSIPFVRAFARYLTEELAPAADKASKTAGAAFARLGNEILALKDAIAQSGLLNFLRDAADEATKLLKKFTDATTAARQQHEAQQQPIGGVLRRDVEQLPPEQRQRLATVQRLINEQMLALNEPPQGGVFGALNTFFTPGVSPEQRKAYLQDLQAEEAEILKGTEAIKAQRVEHERITAEKRKAQIEQDRENNAIDAMRKKLEEVAKIRENFAKQAAFAPELFGSLTGTPEDVAKYRMELQKQLEKPLEELSTTLLQRPKGAGALPNDVVEGVAKLRQEYGGLEAAMKSAEERLATETRLRDVLKSQVEQIQAAIVKHQAEKIAMSESAAAAEAYVRQQTQARQQANVGAEAAMARLPMKQQIALLQGQIGALTPQAEGLASDVEAMKEAEVQQAKFAKANMEQFEILDKLYKQYGLLKAVRDQDSASKAMAALKDTELEAAARKLYEALEPILKIEAQLPDLNAQAAASFKAGMEAMKAARDDTDYTQKLVSALTVMRTPRDQRQSERLAQQAPGGRLTEEQQALINQLREQERLNEIGRVFEQLGTSVGSAWTNALSSIAQGTQSVANAFRQMAQSILQSMAQIASQEAFKALIRLGLGLISTIGTGSAGADESGLGSVFVGGGAIGQGNPTPRLFASGGVVNRPTYAMLGENPATNPEYVMNRQQMQALLSGPSAGGQAAGGNGVTIMNFPSRQEAEQRAAQERALGRQVILNEVMSEMAQGEKSQILRMIRLTSR